METGISVNVKKELSKESNTILAYRGTVKRFSRTVGHGEITKESIVTHLQTLKSENYKESVINYDFERLSSEYIKKSNGDETQRKKDIKKIKNRFYTKGLNSNYNSKALSVELIQKLISETPLRLSLIIETLANTGLRVSELCNLKLDNKDRMQSDLYVTYFIITGKGNRKREIFIENELLDRIKKVFPCKIYLFETVHNQKYNRTYITKAIHEYSGKIIDKNIHSHTLRHSFITNEILEGTPIDAVSRQAGHNNPGFTLSKYSHNHFSREMKKTKFTGKSL